MPNPLFASPADLQEYVFRITFGASDDHPYAVAFSDGRQLFISANGRSYWYGYADPQDLQNRVGSGVARDLHWIDLPAPIRSTILVQANATFADRMAAPAVASTWQEADINDGFYDQAGVGIFRDGDGYRINDGAGPDHCRGPYATYREALRHTLPYWHSISCESFFPSTDPLEAMDDLQGVLEAGPGARVSALRELAGRRPRWAISLLEGTRAPQGAGRAWSVEGLRPQQARSVVCDLLATTDSDLRPRILALASRIGPAGREPTRGFR